MLLLEVEGHFDWEFWFLQGFTAALQGLEDGEIGGKLAKMGVLQMTHSHISEVLPCVWSYFWAPCDAGRSITFLLRAQWTRHHYSFGTF